MGLPRSRGRSARRCAVPPRPSARDGVAGRYGSGCDGPAGAGGLRATFSRPGPIGGSASSWQLAVPEGVTLESLRVARATSGFGGPPVPGDAQWYRAQTSSAEIESAALDDASDLPLDGELSVAPAAGRFLRPRRGLRTARGGDMRFFRRPERSGVDISAVALGVRDGAPPIGVVGGVQSPTAGTLRLLLSASDAGLGLANAEASLDGHTTTFVRLGAAACPERPSPGATIDLPLAWRIAPKPSRGSPSRSRWGRTARTGCASR